MAAIDRSGRWTLNKADAGNTEVFEHLATDDNLKKSLKNYINNLIEYGVTQTEIHFIARESNVQIPQIKQIIAMLETIGYEVTTVSGQQEAADILRAGLPKKYQANGFVLDIEKAQTVIAFAEDSSLTNGSNTYGSHYAEKGITDEQARNSLSQLAVTVPQQKRKVCFVIGTGTSDFLGALNNNERFMAMKSPESYESSGSAKGGLNIYKAVYEKTGCRQFIYDGQSNAAVGYLLRLN